MDANTANPPDNTEPADETLGHYALRRRLGEGGFGEVFEAWDTRLRRSVAVKRLKLVTEGLRPDQLLTEARLAASLNHDAFVDIFAIDGQDDSQFIVMEMVPGSTLQSFIREQQPDEHRALEIIEQIAAAMAQAHGSQLVHGDLKPSNLMVEPTGRIRILDFGLARQIDPLATGSGSQTGQEGTIAYMAPERLLGRQPDTASDIYALGVILYELLAGERPFAGLHGLALAAAHMQSRPEAWPLPEGVSPACAALVRQMTAREPALRPTSMQAVCEAARQVREGRAPALRRQGRVLDGTLVPRFGRKALLLSLLGVALLVGGAIAYRQLDVQHAFAPRPSEASLMNAGMAALHNFDRDDELQAATDRFKEILQYNPQHAAAAAGLAIAYSLRYAGDGKDETWLQRADASAKLALQLDDQLALAHAAMGWVQEHQGKLEEALASETRALALDPRNFYALNGKAQLMLRQGKRAEAEEVIRLAMGHYPRERLFTDLLGTLRYQQGDYRAAEAAFRDSIALQPDAVYAYANLNAALVRQNRLDEALQVLQQGLQIRPSGPLYSNLGTALYARGDYLGAAQAFERAASGAKGSPNDYLKWANLGDALRWVPGREQEAGQAYKRAVQLLEPLLSRRPGDATLLTRGALYHARVGNGAVTREWLQRGLASAPDNPDAHFRAVLAYELLGDRAQALSETETAISLGYPVSLFESEPDLIKLRREPRYQQLLLGRNT
ncbi:protein kinase domain-containing protein [Chitinimonas sp.]|uniref:serine/threonine-protein kinase n=1 Tax=Chitinimonas sp. TaxID=1934313 RepID=UPI002F9250D5